MGCTVGGSVSGEDGGGGWTDSQLVGGEKNRKLAKSAEKSWLVGRSPGDRGGAGAGRLTTR